MLKLIEIVILWVYYKLPGQLPIFYVSLYVCILTLIYQWLIAAPTLLMQLVLLYLLYDPYFQLIHSDLKWCVHLSTSLFLNLLIFNSEIYTQINPSFGQLQFFMSDNTLLMH